MFGETLKHVILCINSHIKLLLVPDFRNPACKRVLYDAELPSASVILIFHNEPYSVVVRTIWSVVNSARRSQPWYKHANFIDRQTGRLMAAGEFILYSNKIRVQFCLIDRGSLKNHVCV